MDYLDKKARSKETERISRELLERRAKEAKYFEVHRADETRKFLEGEFWKSFLGPLFSEKSDVKPTKPGEAKTLEEVALEHLLSSGAANFSKSVVDTFDMWMRLGDEAKNKLVEDEERRKRIEELR